MSRARRWSTLALLLLAAALAACSRGTATRTPAATSRAAASTGSPQPASATPTSTVPAPPTSPRISAANAVRLDGAAEFQAAAVQRIAWSADGALLVGTTTTLDRFDPSTGVARRLLTLASPERLLAIAPDGKLVATRTEQAIRVIDPLSGVEQRTFPVAGFVGGALFRGTSNSLALLTDDRVVTLWDVTTGRQQGQLSGFESAAPVYSIEFSSDGKRAVWIARATVQFADVATNALGARLQFEDFVGHAVFSPDGARLATITAGHDANALTGLLQLWDSTGGKELLRITQPVLFAFVAYSPDGALIATGGNDGFALWSATDGAAVRKMDGTRAGNVRLLSFAHDGSALVSISDDGTARVWRIVG